MGRMLRVQNYQLARQPKTKNTKVKRRNGPHLPASLKRQINEIKIPRVTSSEDELEVKENAWDIYEYEEDVAQEESGKNRRFDTIDQLEYRLPSDFEDEEIDEDAAFGKEGAEQTGDIDCEQSNNNSILKEETKLNSDREDDGNGNDTKTNSNVCRNDTSVPFLDDDDDDNCDDDGEEEEEEEEEERHQNMIEAIRENSKGHCEKKHEKSLLCDIYPESKFNLKQSAMGIPGTPGSHQISVDDLLTSLQGMPGFGSLRKRMQQFQKRGVPIQAPLPKVVQDRLERKAGYEKTSKDISKWQRIVKENREASTLFFNRRPEFAAVSTAELASKFEPTTKLEKEITSLLQESGMINENNEETAKELELNKLTVHEVKLRQERLAKMRSFLFQHEAKAKRVKKIKSKTFHRLLQRDYKKQMDCETDPEAAKEAALKQEFKRAQERMTLKHKNTSKWAKRILKRGLKAQEDGSRIAISEQLHTHNMLMRKIHSANHSSSSDESCSEDDCTDGVETGGSGLVLAAKPRSKLLAKAKVETLKVLEGDGEAEIPTTGLFSLPFMARAIEKKRKQANEEAVAILEQLEQLEDGDETALGNISPVKNEVGDDRIPVGRFAFGAMARSRTNIVPCMKAKLDSELEMHVEKVNDSGMSEDDETDNLQTEGMVERERGMDVLRMQEATLENLAINVAGKDDRSELDSIAAVHVTESVGPTPVGFAENKAGCQKLIMGNGNQNNDTACTIASSHLALRSKSGAVGTPFSAQAFSGSQWLFGNIEKRHLVDSKAKLSMCTKDSKMELSTFIEKTKQERMQYKEACKDSMLPVTIAGRASKIKRDIVENEVRKDCMNENSLASDELGSVAQVQKAVLVSLPESDTEEEPNNAHTSSGLGFSLLNGSASQEELIQRAFASDNVEAEFEELKAQALDEEVPRGEEPINLPGWGQWTSVQKKNGPPQWMVKEKGELEKRRAIALSKRKDSKLKYVLIREKMDKKAGKFMSPNLPFPYKSKEVFERSIRMPVGRDFNTDQAFRDMIRPSVVKDAGVIIDPIKYEMAEITDEGDRALHGLTTERRKRCHQKQDNDFIRHFKYPKKISIS